MVARQEDKFRDGNGREISMRDYVDLRFSVIENGIDVERAAMERRLDGMNEFREALRDTSQKHVTKDEFTIVRNQFDNDIRTLRDFRAEMQGKASQSAVIVAYVLLIGNLFISVVTYLVK